MPLLKNCSSKIKLKDGMKPRFERKCTFAKKLNDL